jgi:hypothetical protein
MRSAKASDDKSKSNVTAGQDCDSCLKIKQMAGESATLRFENRSLLKDVAAKDNKIRELTEMVSSLSAQLSALSKPKGGSAAKSGRKKPAAGGPEELQ